MLEFFKFVGRNCVAGWQFGYGVFALIEAVCIIAIAAAKWWPRKPRSHLDLDKLEGTIMKWAALILGISFVMSTLFVAPFIQFKNSETGRTTAEQNAAMYSNKWERASVQNERVKAAKEKQEKDEERKRVVSLEESARQRDRELVAAIKSSNPARAVLQVIADAPIPKPNLDDFNVKAAEDALADMDKRNEAKAALRLMDESKSEAIAFSNCAPAFDYCIRTFMSVVGELATKNGDYMVPDKYAGLPEVVTNGYTTWISLKTNSAWNFKIWFRGGGIMDVWCPPALSSTVEIRGRDQLETRIAIAGKGEIFAERCPLWQYKATIDQFVTFLIAAQNRQAPVRNTVGRN